MNTNLEAGIQSGLRELGLVKVDESPTIRLHGTSLFSLYHVRFSDGECAVKAMFDPAMAREEQAGLEALAAAGCTVPRCLGVHESGAHAFLFMEFIESGRHPESAPALAAMLRKLYARTYDSWGWPADNFIGSLPQSNGEFADFSEFWWSRRIEPRVRHATEQGRLKKNLGKVLEKLIVVKSEEWGLNRVKPRLIHGDLWSGNVLCSSTNVYLIDPSTARANPEQDLAMLGLFGSSLSTRELESIAEDVGLPPGLEERIPFWRIYPLLVHVNLFGGSYARSLENAVSVYL